MNGILGTSAPLGADLSLIFSILLIIIASIGAWQAHRKQFRSHCPVMAIAGLLNWIPVLFVMIPTWISLLSGERAFGTGFLANIPILHGILGLIAQILITYTVFRMYWLKTLPPKKTLWLMRTTMTLWFLTVIGGIGVYFTAYAL
jgi:uncharacterized membrane protein YozB (DUF420 family)